MMMYPATIGEMVKDLKLLLDEIRYLGPGVPSWQLKKSNFERRLKRIWHYDWKLVVASEKYLGKKRDALLSSYMIKFEEKGKEENI